MERQLFKDLDDIILPLRNELYNKIKDYNVIGIKAEVNDEGVKSIFNKYIKGSEDYFSITVNFTVGNLYIDVEFYYKDKRVNPKCYYIRPKGARYVDQIDILKECLLQDTNEPDITHLELPNN